MKKLTTLVLALALAASLAVPAFAANTTTVPAATYTLNIPADQEIPFGKTSTNIGSISVTDGVGFASGKDLKVTLTYDAFASESVATTIPFLIQLGWAVNSSTSYADINSNDSIIFKGKDTGDISKFTEVRSKTGSQYYDADRTLVAIASTDWGKALAGNYSATITFTAEVVSG